MDEMEVRRMEVPNAVLLGQVKEAIREGHTATINVKGYSMRPFWSIAGIRCVWLRSRI